MADWIMRRLHVEAYRALLRDRRWQSLRREVLELDGSTCARCARGPADGKRLHVHHRQYRAGLKPWEYPTGLLETLCAGCHAAEHGLIVPPLGWELLWESDTGSVDSNCEYCGEPIRYIFTIGHPAWGTLDVGTDCCDRMTGTLVGSALARQKSRVERFVTSTRWSRRATGSLHIKQAGIDVFVFQYGERWRIRMKNRFGNALGSSLYDSELLAKAASFEAIDSGRAAHYLGRRTSPAQSVHG